MTEELANTLTWAAFCAFCVVAVALILDAVSELLRSETPEESARRKARKIVRRANLDLFWWQTKRLAKRAVRNFFQPVRLLRLVVMRRANRQLKNRKHLKTIKSWNL